MSKCHYFSRNSYEEEIIFYDLVNPNNRSSPTSVYLVGICAETLENNQKFRFKHFLSYILTERLCTTSFQLQFGKNVIRHFHSSPVNHFLLQLNIDLVRFGYLYAISLGNSDIHYCPVGVMLGKCPYLYSSFHFRFYTNGYKTKFWNVTMENPLPFTTMKFFNYHFTIEWIDITLQDSENAKLDISNQSFPIPKMIDRSRYHHKNAFIIRYARPFFILNYLFIFLYSIYRLKKMKISKKVKFCRFIYSHNYISFIISNGIQLLLVYIPFFLLSQFYNRSLDLSKMFIHFLLIFLTLSPLNGYSSYRLFIGTLNHFMLLQLCLWFFELGLISLLYCIVCIIKAKLYNGDRELGIIIYFTISSCLSLVGSSFSHPLIAFLDKTQNKASNKNTQNDQFNQKVQINNNNVIEDKIVDSIEELKDLVYESDDDENSETPFINNQKINNFNNNNDGISPKPEINRTYNRTRMPLYLRSWIRCILNSFLIAAIFSGEFFFLIQSILFNNGKIIYIFILFDLISTITFSVFINFIQIKKQVKCGDSSAISLFSSTILSGAFLFIFSLLIYERVKDENLFLSFKFFVSISLFFCISLSLIFSSSTFIAIFVIFINQHKRRNDILFQSI